MSAVCILLRLVSVFFFFNDTATTEIYTLSLHDALPICEASMAALSASKFVCSAMSLMSPMISPIACVRSVKSRSEEHTSELQSHVNLVCRLLLEKKKTEDLCQTLDTVQP